MERNEVSEHINSDFSYEQLVFEANRSCTRAQDDSYYGKSISSVIALSLLAALLNPRRCTP